MAKFKGRIIFDVKFKDMIFQLNIVQKVALHKCSQQIECYHKMSLELRIKTPSSEECFCWNNY